MYNKRKILGQGLSALISDTMPIHVRNSISIDNSMDIELPIENIEPNPWQPRKFFEESELIELKKSILEHGIIQPISVRKIDGKFQIIAGERRWQAAKLAGKTKIPAFLISFDDRQMLEVALVENIQRQNLNAIDEAKAFQRMSEEYKYTQMQISLKVGRSRSYIANSLRLLTLPTDVQDKIINRKLSASHARTLIGKNNISEKAHNMIVSKLSVRDSEKIHNDKASRRKANPACHDLANVQSILCKSLSMNVEISMKNDSGKLIIDFSTIDQLDSLVQKLMSNNLLF